MEASTTIRKMMRDAEAIIVPSYQRAYAWETPTKPNEPKNVDVFLSDLEEYSQSGTNSPYYFGHFLFEQSQSQLQGKFCIVDGQQRLTTIVIFLSVLFVRLESLQEELSDEQTECLEAMIKRGKKIQKIRFETVDYDNQFFQDYVINQTKKDKVGIETESAKRIAKAFDYFTKILANKDIEYLRKLLHVVAHAACTTHTVTSESEAIQMFIFQNSRGKKPSKLELVKAQFMHHIHLYGGENSQNLIKIVTNRFSSIYKSISSIGYKIDEDSVLRYTLQVHKNTLSEIDTTTFINERLADGKGIIFIEQFSQELEISFNHLKVFFGDDERNNHDIHSLLTLGSIAVALPFILKAYRFDLNSKEKGSLCKALESLVLRHRLIGTRADINTRMNPVFVKFTVTNQAITPIIERINFLKNTEEGWWAYWTNEELKKSIKGWLHPSIARFLLWKYENYLESQEKPGYNLRRYDAIVQPELEHIAPVTEPSKKIHGYDNYDEKFKNNYLDCLGNYLLISKKHNASIGNIPFAQKHASYTVLAQQREVQRLVAEDGIWTRDVIKQRKQKIIDFILTTF